MQTLPVPSELNKVRTAFAEWASKQEPGIAALFEQYRTLSQSYSSHTPVSYTHLSDHPQRAATPLADVELPVVSATGSVRIYRGQRIYA